MDVLVPRENNNDDIVMISKLHYQSGDYVEKDSDLIEFETSKTVVVLQAPVSGYVTFLHAENDEVSVNSVVCSINDDSPPSSTASPEINEKDQSQLSVVVNDDVESEAEYKRLFSDAAIGIEQGSRTNLPTDGQFWVTSRILRGDKRNPPPDNKSGETRALSGSSLAGTKLDATQTLDFDVSKTSMRKRAEISSLDVSGGGVFQSTIGCEILAGRRIVDTLSFDDSIQDLVVFETCMLLSGDFKELNRFFISQHEIGVYQEVKPGVSLDLDNNLTVATIGNASSLSLLNLQEAMSDLIVRFADGKLTSLDLSPSSFTVTDLSSTPATFVRPLLNSAQSLIVGIVRSGAKEFKIFATFDHRVSSGRLVALFLGALKQRIESYFDNDTEADVCASCGASPLRASTFGRPGLFQVKTASGLDWICWGCMNG